MTHVHTPLYENLETAMAIPKWPVTVLVVVSCHLFIDCCVLLHSMKPAHAMSYVYAVPVHLQMR